MVADAYATCLRLAREHYENFPVASRLLPRAARPHIAAVYAFARTADDFADEGDAEPAERIARLDGWETRLDAALAAEVEDDGTDEARIFAAVRDTIRKFDLEPQLFRDLLSAFRQDVLVTRYDTWDGLIDYSRRSANPVGRLVLRVAGYRDPTLDDWSDDVCTALQLTNFWQDVERDWAKGRVYVPADAMRASGAREDDLAGRQWTSAWRETMAGLAGRTRAMFDRGRPVADGVSGRLRWELRATWLGGVRILERLERVDFDVFRARPTLGWLDMPVILWRTLAWPPGERSARSE